MQWCHYRFREVWRLDADPDGVYRLLEQVERYPAWWPQVREVRRAGPATAVLRFRSFLPYELTVIARSARQDPVHRVLEVAMTGDLEGWVRWTVRAGANTDDPDRTDDAGGTGGTRATELLFEQEVVVRKFLMRLFALPGRPFFLANHALMMRRGRRGLRAHLAAAAPYPV